MHTTHAHKINQKSYILPHFLPPEPKNMTDVDAGAMEEAKELFDISKILDEAEKRLQEARNLRDQPDDAGNMIMEGNERYVTKSNR